ncbi:N-acetylmuramoyl-L-alanine amidase [bacterium]|nr:N-acetylmuramoyl-L-alanine amidase [bacterium]
MTLAIRDRPSPNFNARLHPVDMLVLHYTGMVDGESAVARLCDPASEVSAHYVVWEDGSVDRLVDETHRAWHAGRSTWRGDDDLNSRSIGVEIVNGGHDFGLPPFPDEQIRAVVGLCRYVMQRWDIPQIRIVGHSDIAPGRKADPGERFPWRRLAEEGIGLWPSAPAPFSAALVASRRGDAGDHVVELKSLLARIGYALDGSAEFDEQTQAVVRAFQRRWRPVAVSGQADLATVQMVTAVAQLYAAADR